MTMEFDLIGLDASMANAIRRIMIAEVPTVAIEKVFMMNNTGIMQDEVLSHRLGLIPLKADPHAFQFKKASQNPTDLNTIVMKLDVKCSRKQGVPASETDPEKAYENSTVRAGDLVWEPKGEQATRFVGAPIQPANPDIVITKLRPGQEIVAELHCEKGLGKVHAKWSPVGTAFYRLLPDIILQRAIEGKAAHRFKALFPPGVIEVSKEKGKEVAIVANPRLYTMDREVLRHKEFEDAVKLTHVRNHFIFGVESTGAMTPDTIVIDALDILKKKCQAVKDALTKLSDPDAM